MKIFNRVLAMLLTLVTVLAVLPIGAMADAWLEVDAKTDAESGGTVTDVTVTVDPSALLAYLKGGNISALLAGISLNNVKGVLTLNEVLEIVPQATWTEIINDAMNAIGDDLDAIVNLAAAADLIDPAKLSSGYYDEAKLKQLIAEKTASGLSDYIVTENLKSLLSSVEASTLGDYVDETNLKTLLSSMDLSLLGDYVKEANLKNLLSSVTASTLGDYIDEDALRTLLSAKSAETLADYLDETAFRGLLSGKAASLSAYVKNDRLKDLFAGKTYNDLKACINCDDLLAKISGTTYSAVAAYIDESAAIAILEREVDAALLAPYYNGSELDVAAVYADKSITTTALLNALVEGNAIDVTAMLLGAAPLFSVAELANEGIINVSAMLTGSTKIFEVQELLDADVVDLDLAMSGNGSDIAPLFTTAELLDNNIILIDTIVSGDEANGIPALFTVTELLNADVVDLDLVLSGDEASGIPALFTVTELLNADVVDLDLVLSGDEANGIPALFTVTELLNADVVDLDLVLSGDEANGIPALFTVADLLADGTLNLNAILMGDKASGIPALIDVRQLYTAGVITSNSLQTALTLLGTDKIVSYVTRVYNAIRKNVDQITLGGYVIAEEDDLAFLTLNATNLVRALKELIPTLEDLRNLETNGTLLKTDFSFTYQSEATGDLPKTKAFHVTVQLDGGVEAVKKIRLAAEKLLEQLKKYVPDFNYTGGTLQLGVVIPAQFADTFAKLLEKLDEVNPTLKEQILALHDKTAADMVEFVNQLTVGEIRQILEMVDANDFRAAYQRVMASSYVDFLLNYIKTATGYDFTGYTLEDLIGKADELPTLRQICEKLKSLTGVDVLSKLPVSDGTADAQVLELFTKAVQKATGYTVNFQEILENAMTAADPVQALYDAVLEKISDAAGMFEAIKNRVLPYVERALNSSIGSEINGITLDGLYRNNGLFSASASASIDVKQLLQIASDAFFAKAGSYIELATGKVLDRLPVDTSGVISTDVVQKAINKILAAMPEYTYSFSLELDVTVAKLHRITFYDTDGTTVLKTVFLPAGVKLDSILRYTPETLDTKFLGWKDVNGETIYTAMPDADVAVVATVESTEEEARFVLPGLVEGTDYVINQLPDGSYEIVLTEIPTALDLVMSRKVLEEVDAAGASVKVRSADSRYSVTFDNATVKTLLATGFATSATFRYAAAETGTVYDAAVQGVKTHQMSFLFDADTEETHLDFAGCNLAVVLPFDDAINTVEKKTFVTTKNTAGEREEVAVVADAAAKTVSFTAPHFSEFALVNKYNLTLSNQYVILSATNPGESETVTGSAPIANAPVSTGYYAEGETLTVASSVTLTELADFKAANYRWAYLTLVYGTNTTTVAGGEAFTMPGEAVTMMHTVIANQLRIFYYVNGALWKTTSYFVADAETEKEKGPEALPTGYTSWYGYDAAKIGVSDLYVFAIGDEPGVKYTLEFYLNKEDTTPAKSYSYIAAEWLVQISKLPTVPALAEKNGVWRDAAGKAISEYDWATVFTGSAKVVKFYASYEERDFNIVAGNGTFVKGGLVSAPAFSEVTVGVEARTGMTVTLKMRNFVTGIVQTLELDENLEATFVMPAADVSVYATYTVNILSYTDASGNEKSAPYGTILTFDVTVPAGMVLAVDPAKLEGAPAELEQIAVATKNRARVLTYQYTLTEDGFSEEAFLATIKANITALSYRVFRIINGRAVTSDAAAEALLHSENAALKGWSTAVANNFTFALLEYRAPATSLLWLWICLIVLAVILLIAFCYTMYIRGTWKPNFFLRFIAWLVSIFFAICMGIAAAGLAIARLFGYHEPEPEEEEELPEEEKTAEPEEETDENAETDASEATETPAEEPAEDAEKASDEASGETSETADEASDETSEETSGETSDETSDEGSEDEKNQ